MRRLPWLDDTPDKYSLAGLPSIDCAARLHLCNARCCTFEFDLSAQDLREGGIEHDPRVPYRIRQRADGYCAHNGGGHTCTIYVRRPAACRRFDCRNDATIWADFEAHVPARAAR